MVDASVIRAGRKNNALMELNTVTHKGIATTSSSSSSATAPAAAEAEIYYICTQTKANQVVQKKPKENNPKKRT